MEKNSLKPKFWSFIHLLVWEAKARAMDCFRCCQEMSLPKWEPVSVMENLILMLVISSPRDPKWSASPRVHTFCAQTPKPHPRRAHSVSCTIPELSLTEKLISLHFSHRRGKSIRNVRKKTCGQGRLKAKIGFSPKSLACLEIPLHFSHLGA